jgi:hypothetical protein
MLVENAVLQSLFVILSNLQLIMNLPFPLNSAHIRDSARFYKFRALTHIPHNSA